jgi:hypothetical protein
MWTKFCRRPSRETDGKEEDEEGSPKIKTLLGKSEENE